MRSRGTVVAMLVLTVSLCAQKSSQENVRKRSAVVYQDITFIGVKQMPVATLQRIARRYEGQPFGDVFASELEEQVRELYQQRGFFRVQITRESAGPVDSQKHPSPVIYKIEEGRRYRLKAIKFENGKVFPVASLRPLLPIHSGEIFDISKIRLGLENLRQAYGRLGYINFTPVPDTSVDEGDATVSLIIDLDEGEQFRIGNVEFRGFSSTVREHLRSDWKLAAAQPFDSTYIAQFYEAHRALLPRPGSWEVIRNDKNHTVDIIWGSSED